MNLKIKVLHLEDNPTDADLIEYELSKGGLQFEKQVVDSREEYEEMLSKFIPDIVLSDHSLPAFNSFRALEILKDSKMDIPFILVTATVSEEFAVDIMKQGADDYVLKDRLQRLPSAVINSIEKHRLEREKKAVNERLAFHLENTPLGFIELDNCGIVKYWSKRAEEILGWNRKALIENRGDNLSQVYEEDKPLAKKIIEQLLSGEVERNKVQCRHITANGKVIWCEWFNSVLKDEFGKVRTIMSLVQDITEQKHMEKQKDNFFSVASHELKTPVTTIKAYGQLAENLLEKKEDNETLDVIKRMGAQVNRLTSLIGTLLDFTKIQNGQLLYDEAFFDFNDLVQETVNDMQKTSYSHEIKNNPISDAFVFGDRNKISQVLTNLISNAIKYSPDSEEIIISTSTYGNGVELSVRDFGIGIPAEDLQNVFKQFYRVSGESQSTFPGMGIGLYICSEVITRHGGKIWVESIMGKGSIFYAWIPADHRQEGL
jgi:PAS domain S-box-containing protein